jgi:hypothetical protein
MNVPTTGRQHAAWVDPALDPFADHIQENAPEDIADAILRWFPGTQ